MPPAAARQFVAGRTPALRGETGTGEGPTIVLCHGLTATRGLVIHGSQALARAGYRVVLYDARGHGKSDAAPVGEGYGYPQLVADLETVTDAEAGKGPIFLSGHSMGAHTAIAFALRHPQRLAGLIAIGPTYAAPADEQALAYWDGLADALEAGGVDGFVERIDRSLGTDPAWRDSVLRFTRERMLRHRDLDAVAAALRGVPRSAPFENLEALAKLEVPTLVVASHDAADPGHPYAVAREYAERLPRARLVSEAEGQSPLAWQGGRLSREVAKFAAELA
jgi:pimeloyl-ACP methyl ester carboxylesterase